VAWLHASKHTSQHSTHLTSAHSLPSTPQVQARALHTLRSSIPDEDASPERWAAFTGVPTSSPLSTTYMVVADPRFTQVRQLLAGLDYAYPGATKIGALLAGSPAGLVVYLSIGLLACWHGVAGWRGAGCMRRSCAPGSVTWRRLHAAQLCPWQCDVAQAACGAAVPLAV
jgi:small ligand-binding sensory domain FIST